MQYSGFPRFASAGTALPSVFLRRRSTAVADLRPSDAAQWKRLAIVCWAILLSVVAVRLTVQQSIRNSVFDVFTVAGQSWIDGKDPYSNPHKLFRYSPTAAAAFAPWALIPARPAEIIWRLGSAAAFVAAFLSFLRTCVLTFDETRRWAAVLGSLPLALMSVNNGQANIILAALLFFAMADALRERWNRCAAALAAAVLLKLWPIAAAGLLVVCFPRKLGWRFAVALVIGLLTPFFTHRWDYVVEMYRSWLHYLPSDTRIGVNVLDGNRDFWLVNRLVGSPLDPMQYRALQLASGVCLAVWAAWLRWRGRSPQELVGFVAFTGTIWMLGFGPATESCTYSLIGPLLAWAWLDPSRSKESRFECLLLLASIALFVVSLLSVPTPFCKRIEAFGLQPIGAALLFVRMTIAGRPVAFGRSADRVSPRLTSSLPPWRAPNTCGRPVG